VIAARYSGAMPRRIVSRRRADVLSFSSFVAGLVAACSGCAGSNSSFERASDGPWIDGFPRGEATVVTIENLSYDPPRMLGLVSEDHPAAASEAAALRSSGIKRIPAACVDELLQELEQDGFLPASAPLPAIRPADPALVLRRLTVTIGGERRAFTLPRRPPKELAERFNALAHAVQQAFNETVDFRRETANRDPFFFYEVQQRLFDLNEQKRRVARKGGAP